VDTSIEQEPCGQPVVDAYQSPTIPAQLTSLVVRNRTPRGGLIRASVDDNAFRLELPVQHWAHCFICECLGGRTDQRLVLEVWR